MFDIRHRNASYSIRELFQDVSEIHSYDARSPSFSKFCKKKKKSSRISIRLHSFSKSLEMPLKLKNLLKNEFRKVIKEKSLTFSLYKTLKLTLNKSFKRPSFSEMFYLILVFFFSPANILYPLLVLDNILNLFILSVLTKLLIISSFWTLL